DWLKQSSRRRVAQQGIDILQMLAEQLVEQSVECRGMIIPVPPEPVAPLGDVQFLPGTLQAVLFHPAGRMGRMEVLAGAMNRVPGTVVLLMTNPDREVVRDPTAGEQLVDAVPRGVLIEVLQHRDGLNVLAADGALIHVPQESDTAVRV